MFIRMLSPQLDCRNQGSDQSLPRYTIGIQRGGETTMFTPRPIGHVRSPYAETRQIPKGLGAKHEADGILEIQPEFEVGLTDIEGFSHLYVLWAFDRSQGFDLLGTPPSDNRPHGVFATRSPRRPNPIGLTVVELLRRDGPRLHVRGADMLDGTPILDIKPYLSSVPPDRLRRGWLAEAEEREK
jgi:tRNA (adenine37-N6)-methyltransferase